LAQNQNAKNAYTTAYNVTLRRSLTNALTLRTDDLPPAPRRSAYLAL
jgi:hypothetical protein